MADTDDEAARLRSAAARALGAASASKAGKASQAKIMPEERSRRAKIAINARWAKYRAAKDAPK
jgi:hypothetical protein